MALCYFRKGSMSDRTVYSHSGWIFSSLPQVTQAFKLVLQSPWEKGSPNTGAMCYYCFAEPAKRKRKSGKLITWEINRSESSWCFTVAGSLRSSLYSSPTIKMLNSIICSVTGLTSFSSCFLISLLIWKGRKKGENKKWFNAFFLFVISQEINPHYSPQTRFLPILDLFHVKSIPRYVYVHMVSHPSTAHYIRKLGSKHLSYVGQKLLQLLQTWRFLWLLMGQKTWSPLHKCCVDRNTWGQYWWVTLMVTDTLNDMWKLQSKAQHAHLSHQHTCLPCTITECSWSLRDRGDN